MKPSPCLRRAQRCSLFAPNRSSPQRVVRRIRLTRWPALTPSRSSLRRSKQAPTSTCGRLMRWGARGAALPLLRIDPEVERSQVERLGKLRARRDASRLQAALRRVEETARSEQNLMPAILEAVKAYATVGEISDALRKVFGEYQESVVI